MKMVAGCIFRQAYVIGAGSVAVNCAKELVRLGIKVTFIESRKDVAISYSERCRKNNMDFLQLQGKELTEFLMGTDERTLIVSASNRYLFPEEVIAKDNLKIINYHGALLPDYPGRNAEAWAIYYGNKRGGVTWHYVSPVVDGGDIIIQESIALDKDETSLSLLRKYSHLAVESFKAIVIELLQDKAAASRQESAKDRKFYYSWMKPNGGILDRSWDYEKTSCFLRAMDYGPLKVMGTPKIEIDGVLCGIKDYFLEDGARIIIEKQDGTEEIKVPESK